jgi:hypothetical protein
VTTHRAVDVSCLRCECRRAVVDPKQLPLHSCDIGVLAASVDIIVRPFAARVRVSACYGCACGWRTRFAALPFCSARSSSLDPPPPASLQASQNLESQVSSDPSQAARSAALWLWGVHNRVNARLGPQWGHSIAEVLYPNVQVRLNHSQPSQSR